MFDVKWIRENPAEFDRGLARRGLAPRAAGILRHDEAWRAAETAAQEIQARRNKIAKGSGGEG
jgi:seryl-tRNA synthetase